jgi:HEAT repeat protein
MTFLGFGRPDVERLDAKGDIEALIRAAKYRKDAGVREAARLALERRLDFFVAKLASKNLRRVVLSREALKLIGEPAVVLLSDVLEKGDVGKRRDAAFALGEVGLPSGLPALERALRDRDPHVRVLAVKSLVRLDDDRVLKALEPALKDRDEAVHYHAVKAVRKLTR